MGASGNNPNGTPDLGGVDTPTAAESNAPPPLFPSGEKPADMVGPYKLLEMIGEGGFGTVWLAERREPIVQQVALKILNPGMNSREILARFEQERQALAVMNHPNVAMVIDAGATPTGRPYFAMEYVPGEAITAYCDRHRLSIRERLQLFIPVCEAVQHAHHKGIIHRDIKPSNILVAVHEGRAVPKVIDFGVAKAVSHTLTQKTIFTEHGKLIGTPEYMSPEQAEMGATDVDTRTDVYALGVVLYELLSGLLPFDARMLREGGLLAICRIIREQEPPRPSTRLSTIADADSTILATNRHTQREQLSRELRRELDWIPLKAIRKDRAERYGTPMDLAQDIQRYLNGEALEAGPPSTMYRLGKLARRHRTAIVGTAIVLIVVAAGVTSTVIALSRAAAQAVVAEASNRRAEGTKEFARQVISALEPSGSFEATRTRTLALIDKAIADTSVAFEGDSTTRPEVLNTIGLSFRAAGKLDLAEPCLRRAFEMRRAALGADNPTTWQSAHELAYLYDDMGNAAEAVPLARQTVAEQTRLLGVLHNDTLASIQLLGVILVSRADTAQEGQQLLEHTLRSSRENWGPESVRTASLESNTAQCYKKADQLDLARPLYEHALSVMKAQLGDDDPETLAVASNLAGAYSIGGDAGQARTILVDLVPRCRRVLGDEHPQTLRTMNNLGSVSDTLDRLDDAETWYTTSLDIQRRVLPAGHPDILTTISNLSIVYYKRNSPESLDRSESLQKEALEQQVRKYGERDIRTLKSVNNLAMLYDRMGKPEAGAMYERLLAIAPAVLGPAHVDTLIYTSNAADWFERSGNIDKAQELYELAAGVSAKERGESDFAALWSASDLAIFWRIRGKTDVAIPMHERIVALARAAKVVPNTLGVFLTGYGKTLLAAKRFQDAVAVLEEAEAMLASVLGEESPQLASTREALKTAREQLSAHTP